MNLPIEENKKESRCGCMAIIGRSNVGKSSLLNALLKKKISITTYKPQTTRRPILGVKTEENTQVMYLDTPGFQSETKKVLDRQMNRSALSTLREANGLIWVVEALKWYPEEEILGKKLATFTRPLILAINKVDVVRSRASLMTFAEKLHLQFPQAEIVPISAKKAYNLEPLERLVEKCMPEAMFCFESTDLWHATDFHCSEIIREKLMMCLHQELPYALGVKIEALQCDASHMRIHAVIWVEKGSQKSIVIGEKGSMLKRVGTLARREIAGFYKKAVCLKLWVKVKTGWTDNASLISALDTDA